MQRCGPAEVKASFEAGESISLLILLEGAEAEVTNPLVKLAEVAGVRIDWVNENHMRRMAREGVPEALALVGRELVETLEEVMAISSQKTTGQGKPRQEKPGQENPVGGNGPSNAGPVVLLCGVSYALNVGYSIRTAEVSGASAVVLDTPLNSDGRKTAIRASMRADRVIPVLWESSEDAVRLAKAAGRTVVAIEDCGTSEPWDVDLGGDILLIIGAEGEGIPKGILDLCDEVVVIPMEGFYPCYNLQAALAVTLVEALKQRR